MAKRRPNFSHRASFRLCIAIGSLIVVGGCASTGTMIVLMPDHDGNVGTLTATTHAGEMSLTTANRPLMLSDESKPPAMASPMTDDELGAVFVDALGVEPIPFKSVMLYFEPESAMPLNDSLSVIAGIANDVVARDSQDVVVIGHTDTMGEADFNMKLSDKRVTKVRGLLIKAGVDEAFISTSYHGEGDLLVQTPDEKPEPRNRRVEVVIR